MTSMMIYTALAIHAARQNNAASQHQGLVLDNLHVSVPPGQAQGEFAAAALHVASPRLDARGAQGHNDEETGLGRASNPFDGRGDLVIPWGAPQGKRVSGQTRESQIPFEDRAAVGMEHWDYVGDGEGRDRRGRNLV